MSMLVVGAVTVSVANDGAKEADDSIYDLARMQDGTMRGTVQGSFKRKWSITTILMSDATAATLRSAIRTTSLPVTCSGDLLGGTVSCIPRLTNYEPVNARGVLKRRVSFDLYEV